jgi:hypothetical protein
LLPPSSPTPDTRRGSRRPGRLGRPREAMGWPTTPLRPGLQSSHIDVTPGKAKGLVGSAPLPQATSGSKPHLAPTASGR